MFRHHPLHGVSRSTYTALNGREPLHVLMTFVNAVTVACAPFISRLSFSTDASLLGCNHTSIGNLAYLSVHAATPEERTYYKETVERWRRLVEENSHSSDTSIASTYPVSISLSISVLLCFLLFPYPFYSLFINPTTSLFSLFVFFISIFFLLTYFVILGSYGKVTTSSPLIFVIVIPIIIVSFYLSDPKV